MKTKRSTIKRNIIAALLVAGASLAGLSHAVPANGEYGTGRMYCYLDKSYFTCDIWHGCRIVYVLVQVPCTRD